MRRQFTGRSCTRVLAYHICVTVELTATDNDNNDTIDYDDNYDSARTNSMERRVLSLLDPMQDEDWSNKLSLTCMQRGP